MAEHHRPPASSEHAARQLAWEILQRVEDGAFADALLGHRLSGGKLEPRDAGLVTRLVYSTLTWQTYLDHLLAPFSRRPLTQVDPPIRSLLRMAMAQMCVLTRVPSFAAVDTAVELAKSHGRGAAGFVNAVLRKAAGKWQSVPLPPTDDRPAFLSVRWSHPRWLVERWLEIYGDSETEALLQANNEPAPTVVRANRLRCDPRELLIELRALGLEVEPCRYAPLGLRLDHAPGLDRLPAYRDGVFSLQGEASQLVAHILAARPGEKVLDVCAAPGGKSLHSAELMDDRGSVVARDIHARGVARIRKEAERLKLTIVKAEIADAVRWSAHAAVEPFDRVLVDAPCSGLGTLRAHPELKWKRRPDDSGGLAALQLRILDGAAAEVGPGGVLVYSTCTILPEENEEVTARFLATHPQFILSNPIADLPEPMRALIGEDGALRTLPHRHGLDGFYAVRLMRR